VTGLAYGPSSGTLFSAGDDGLILAWAPRLLREGRTPLTPREGEGGGGDGDGVGDGGGVGSGADIGSLMRAAWGPGQ
jgi:hypothetical protein